MDIQDEPIGTSDPLSQLDEDYAHAVLHVAWDWERTTDSVTLLFGFVELIPREIPPPIDDYDYRSPGSGRSIGKDKNHHIYARHAVVPARRAIEWYEQCGAGLAVLPSEDGSLPERGASDEVRMRIGQLGQEPKWPRLISTMNDAATAPFSPRWIDCPRVHHRLPVEQFDPSTLWGASERETSQIWLSDHFHFDFAKYPEYWGSVHLVAPNPIYRSLDSRLSPGVPPAESVLLRFQPRADRSIRGLAIGFRETDPWGVTAERQIDVQRELLRVNFDRPINAILADVSDATRGLLEVSSTAFPFVREIQLQIGLIAEQTTVRAKDGSSYVVSKSGTPETSTIGKSAHVDSTRSQILSAHFRREQSQAATNRHQRWFLDKQDEAREALRALLESAADDVLLVDPYFGSDDLMKFMLSVSRYDIPISILSSAKGLKEFADANGSVEKGADLLARVTQLKSKERMNAISVRAMPGKEPAIHDRFIVIGRKVWLLGSSLHSFGQRGTMMIELPDPTEVRADLMAAWTEATDLASWVAGRDQRRGADPK